MPGPDKDVDNVTPPRDSIPPGEADTVQRLVRNEVDNLWELMRAERKLSLRNERDDLLARVRTIEDELGEQAACSHCRNCSYCRRCRDRRKSK